ncbi:prolyl-tRNA synthetase [Cantharellus anzutake]|uniref:prolyl-tRNA synthetase n=1 Tax=Cantharellus anzutake TaxID=1750568 RepID=UPI0019062218|nr:prolyl-tRNA synthetase [Cantharellus anzutake]KAF8327228.1 prolyl-tRNA synthetase [Cantharellus anzutake]
MSMADITSKLRALNLTHGAFVSHAPTTSPASWKEELTKTGNVPTPYQLVKTLVFKPKTAKNATPIPVIVIAREDTETNSSALGKRLNLKDLRLASADILQEFLGVDKDALSALSLTPETFPKVHTIIDASLAESSSFYALHPSKSDATVFLRGQDIATYLRSLETPEHTVLVEDFQALKAESLVQPAPSVAAKKPEQKGEKEDARIEGAKLIAIGIKKEVDFAGWYTNVLIKSEMIDYYTVSGCYILKPWSYTIWEAIQEWFNARIKDMGVENAYFPLFVSQKVLEREKDHIEGFAPEVAWVTRAGSSELEEPVAIRPTSETVMYPYYAKWIQSYRDLPLKLNQWNSVVRWEFKNPQPFLRTREFLWQEGHTAHARKEDADIEVRQILDLYRRVYEELLAVPVIPGVKSEKEKFAGGLYTTTVEGFIPTSGRGIQAATSHCLGQNFSKMFEIVVEDPEKPAGSKDSKLFVWQNSWGLSTRAIGVMVMVHGDNQGLVLPPRVASVQVVVIPCGLTAKMSAEEKKRILDACDDTAATLKKAGVRARADLRDTYTPGWKFADWEQKGVPLRLEIGPQDLRANKTLGVRRDDATRHDISIKELTTAVPALLNKIQDDMYKRANDIFQARLKTVTEWDQLVPTLDAKCIAVIPWCEETSCEDDIKERSARAAEQTDERAPSAGAKSLCIPFNQERWGTPAEGYKCPACQRPAKRWSMFGRSY